MTTEEKAQALVDAVRSEYPLVAEFHATNIALCRAIEQHEAFRQEVSNAAQEYEEAGYCMGWEGFERFIIPKPKPDPLVEALAQLDFLPWKKLSGHADDFRAALDALGFEIREKNDD